MGGGSWQGALGAASGSHGPCMWLEHIVEVVRVTYVLGLCQAIIPGCWEYQYLHCISWCAAPVMAPSQLQQRSSRALAAAANLAPCAGVMAAPHAVCWCWRKGDAWHLDGWVGLCTNT
jgi:hypothetical protein